MNEISFSIVTISILSSTLRMSTPYLLASLGELLAEKSGVLNMSVEGMMTVGAFFGFLATTFTGDPWIGLLAAFVSGCAAAFIFAVMTVFLRANQIVTGIAMNLLTVGIATYLFRVVYGMSSANAPFAKNTFVPLKIPFLSQIPYIGEILFSQYLLVYIAFLVVPLASILLFHTTFGLSVVAVGEYPSAADTRGINVTAVRCISTVLGGGMAGLAGSFLVIATSNVFTPGVVAGRGWIAIILVVFGKWMPKNILIGGILFGFLEAVCLQFQALPVVNRIPYQFLMMLPYIAAVIVLFSVRNVRFGAMPTFLSVPYKGGGK